MPSHPPSGAQPRAAAVTDICTTPKEGALRPPGAWRHAARDCLHLAEGWGKRAPPRATSVLREHGAGVAVAPGGGPERAKSQEREEGIGDAERAFPSTAPCSTGGKDGQGGRPREGRTAGQRGRRRHRNGAGLLATGAWSDGTHCVFCMLFSIPFHPLPELSVHGLQGNDPTARQWLPEAPSYPPP